MFAKDVGIIGIGLAKGRCQMLEPDDSDRLMMTGTREWRVPTAWLAWNNNDAYRWKGRRATFFDVSEDMYRKLRNGVEKHFLSVTFAQR